MPPEDFPGCVDAIAAARRQMLATAGALDLLHLQALAGEELPPQELAALAAVLSDGLEAQADALAIVTGEPGALGV